jgi:hypothetical protein
MQRNYNILKIRMEFANVIRIIQVKIVVSKTLKPVVIVEIMENALIISVDVIMDGSVMNVHSH